MINFPQSRIYNEYPPTHDDYTVQIELGIYYSGPEQAGKRIFKYRKHFKENKKQNDAENYGESDTPLADFRLIACRRSLGFKGNIKKVVETQYCLKQYQHNESEYDFHGSS